MLGCGVVVGWLRVLSYASRKEERLTARADTATYEAVDARPPRRHHDVRSPCHSRYLQPCSCDHLA